MNRRRRSPLVRVVRIAPLKEPAMPYEPTGLPYVVTITIARLASERSSQGAAAIPSIMEEVRFKFPHLEISDRELEEVIAALLDIPSL